MSLAGYAEEVRVVRYSLEEAEEVKGEGVDFGMVTGVFGR